MQNINNVTDAFDGLFHEWEADGNVETAELLRGHAREFAAKNPVPVELAELVARHNAGEWAEMTNEEVQRAYPYSTYAAQRAALERFLSEIPEVG